MNMYGGAGGCGAGSLAAGGVATMVKASQSAAVACFEAALSQVVVKFNLLGAPVASSSLTFDKRKPLSALRERIADLAGVEDAAALRLRLHNSKGRIYRSFTSTLSTLFGIQPPVVFVELMGHECMGVADLPCCADLTTEALDRRAAREVLMEDLERDLLAANRILGEIDRATSPATEHPPDLEAFTDDFADLHPQPLGG